MKKTFAISILALLISGCISMCDCSEEKMKKVQEVAEFLEKSNMTAEKLQKCAEISDQLQLNGHVIVISNGTMRVICP